MKLVAVLIALSSVAVFAQEAKPSAREAKVEQLLTLTGVDSQTDKMMDQMFKMAVANLPSDAPPEVRAKLEEMQTKVFALISERMSWQKMKPVYVKLYAEVYTDEELDGMIAFFSSPAGRSMTAKNPILMQRSMQVVQSLMAEVLPEIKRMTAEAVRR
ncbi:MAG: DUF2059 domain-containing protein [Acidobacteria bacterium]|nr:DUF2059 domain-containing protein [Acidobacteriota bacterium]